MPARSAAFLFVALVGCGGGPGLVAPPAPSLPAPTPVPSAPLPFAGARRFTIAVDPACRSRFPRPFRVRNYDVDVRTAGDHSDIWFESGDVVHLPETHLPPGSGFARDGELRLEFLFSDVVPLERRAPYTFVVRAAAAVPLAGLEASGTVEGPLFADLRYADPDGTEQCTSSSHSFTLDPR